MGFLGGGGQFNLPPYLQRMLRDAAGYAQGMTQEQYLRDFVIPGFQARTQEAMERATGNVMAGSPREDLPDTQRGTAIRGALSDVASRREDMMMPAMIGARGETLRQRLGVVGTGGQNWQPGQSPVGGLFNILGGVQRAYPRGFVLPGSS